MLYYLNNWRNRDHASIYGGSAMYDLWADGVEDKRVRGMQSGDTLLVLNRSGKFDATVGQYVFTKSVRGPIDPTAKREVWILEGTFVSRETLSKAAAAKHSEYGRFFNRHGHVCQWSVLRDSCLGAQAGPPRLGSR